MSVCIRNKLAGYGVPRSPRAEDRGRAGSHRSFQNGPGHQSGGWVGRGANSQSTAEQLGVFRPFSSPQAFDFLTRLIFLSRFPQSFYLSYQLKKTNQPTNQPTPIPVGHAQGLITLAASYIIH